MGGRPRVTEAQALVAIQKVFSGEVTRDCLAELALRELAYVTVALMLVWPNDYVEVAKDNWYATLPLVHAANRLVVHGVPYAQDRQITGYKVAWECTKADLSRATSRRRYKTWIMQLKPPEPLLAIATVAAAESPPIIRFKQTVEDVAAQRQAEIAARRARRGVKP